MGQEEVEISAPYSKDLRQKLITCHEQGELSEEVVAKRFLVSQRTFKRWWKHYQGSERMVPELMGDGVEPKVKKRLERRYKAWLEETPNFNVERAVGAKAVKVKS